MKEDEVDEKETHRRQMKLYRSRLSAATKRTMARSAFLSRCLYREPFLCLLCLLILI
jgi:hypothetical protein